MAKVCIIRRAECNIAFYEDKVTILMIQVGNANSDSRSTEPVLIF